MKPTKKMLGLILAGGQSKRMGEDKGLVLYKGKPLISYPIDLLKQLCQNIVISANNESYEKLGYPVLQDKIKGIGPLGGMYSAFVKYSPTSIFVLPCDVPEMGIDFAKKLINLGNSYDISVASFRGRIEPLIGIYQDSVLNAIEQQIKYKNYKIQNLIKRCNSHVYETSSDTSFNGQKLFKNVNYPNDVE